MIHSLTGLTGVVLKAALDAASMRQTAGAANIANANRPGYVPVRVSFEAELEQALSAQRQRGGEFVAPKPVLHPVETSANGNESASVKLDEESAALVTNALHYQALIGGLRGLSEIVTAAVSDGKR
ncbi:MAG: hypothetical protein QM776_13445 [Rhodocyclaceae bacterium]